MNQFNLRRVLFGVLTLVLIFQLAATGMAATARPSSQMEDWRYVALRHLQQQATAARPTWQGALLGSPQTYQNTHGKDAMVVFPVLNRGQNAGYIAVSTTRLLPPVIESSTAVAPSIEGLPLALSEAGRIIKGAQHLGTARLLYLPPFYYAAEIPIIENGSEVSTLGFDLRERKPIDRYVEFRKEAQQREEVTPRKEILEIWNKTLAARDSGGVTALAGATYKIIPNVKNVKQYGDNCGPAAGAMVLSYWDQWYPNLVDSRDDSNLSNLQNCLHYDMISPPTTFANAEAGIEKHANSAHGYSDTFSYLGGYYFNAVSALNADGTRNSWTGYKREIDLSRPVMVYHDWWYPSTEFSYHWMAGRGYYEDTLTGDRGYYVNDSHGVENRYFDYYTSPSNIAWLYVRNG